MTTRLFVNKLTVMDFSCLDPQRGLIGESWQVDIELTGELDHQGMVLDFGDVKKTVKRLIDAEFDHKLLIPERFSGSSMENLSDGRQANRFTTHKGETFVHTAPADAYCLIDADAICEQAVANSIKQRLQNLLPENVVNLKLHLYPESIDGPFYHYSHGLKQHAGNCQRIAHGHRSRLEIFDHHGRREDLEKHWAERWKDIYIGTREDLKSSTDNTLTFAYQACQGEFELSLPAQRCYLIDTDSTVENIARHLADVSAVEFPGETLTVRAFEGIDKGAIAVSNGLQDKK